MKAIPTPRSIASICRTDDKAGHELLQRFDAALLFAMLLISLVVKLLAGKE